MTETREPGRFATLRLAQGREPTDERRPFRTNIISLVGLGYGSVLVGFLSLRLSAGQPSVDAATAVYDAIKEPLMLLIGGSLALAKDVFQADDEGTPKG